MNSNAPMIVCLCNVDIIVKIVVWLLVIVDILSNHVINTTIITNINLSITITNIIFEIGRQWNKTWVYNI